MTISRLIKIFVVLTICAGATAVAIAYSHTDNYPHKLWLHRCNSLEKLNEMAEDYPNIEVDLVYRKAADLFDVTHDVDTTFNLELSHYFEYFDDTNGKIWLDIKNLNNNNSDSALAELNELITTYEIDQERLIVESDDLHSLKLFTKDGFYTSYYVDFKKPSQLDEKEIECCIDHLQDVADSGHTRALSFAGWWYSTIKDELDTNIDLLTWKHRTTPLELLLTPEGHEMINDPQLKVILVKDKGNYHR